MKKLLKDFDFWKGFFLGSLLVAVVLTIVGIVFGFI